MFLEWICEHTTVALLVNWQLYNDWHPLDVVTLSSRKFIKLISALKFVVRRAFVKYFNEMQEHCIYSIFPVLPL